MDEKLSEKYKHDQWLNDIRHVLSSPQGRRVYWGLMERCKAFSDSYISDTNLCYFQKGQRTIGIGMLEDLLEAEPKMYLQMIQEKESQEVRQNIKQEKQIADKTKNPTRIPSTYDPLKIDSPSVPNTAAEMSMGGSR